MTRGAATAAGLINASSYFSPLFQKFSRFFPGSTADRENTKYPVETSDKPCGLTGFREECARDSVNGKLYYSYSSRVLPMWRGSLQDWRGMNQEKGSNFQLSNVQINSWITLMLEFPVFTNGFWMAMVCPRRLSFSQFVILMKNGVKNSLLGKPIPLQK